MLVVGEPFPPNIEMAKRWNVSTTTVCHYLQALRDEGHDIPVSPRGGKRVRALRLNGAAPVERGESFAIPLNGNGRAHVA